jgi:histidinol-phosphate aminotransferase
MCCKKDVLWFERAPEALSIIDEVVDMKNAKDEASNNYYFRRLVRSEVLSLEEYSAGPAPSSEGSVRISANENGFGPAPAVRDAVSNYLAGKSELYRYPDSSCGALREELSKKHGLPPEWFLVGNGLDDVISIIGMTFLNPGDEVLLPALSFVMYESAARLPGAAPVMIPMKPDMSIDVAAMASSVTSATKMIMLCSPNNPTGTIVRTGEFVGLLDVLSEMPAQPLLVVDQAYADFVGSDEDYPNVIGRIENYNNIMVLRTFSKMSAIAGLRIGYAVAHPALLSYMNRVRLPYTVNSLAQVAALADIREESAAEHRSAVKRSIAANREKLEKLFEEEGVSFVRSYANFVFALYDLEMDDLTRLSGEMVGEGILARTLRYGGANSRRAGIRFSIGTDEENERLIKTLRTILPKYRKKTSR